MLGTAQVLRGQEGIQNTLAPERGSLGYDAGDANLYRYVGNSPTNKTDPSGLAPNQQGTTNPRHVLDRVRELEGQGLRRLQILERIRDEHTGNENRYFFTDQHDWVDIRHFAESARLSLTIKWGIEIVTPLTPSGVAGFTGRNTTRCLGFANEVGQWMTERFRGGYRSGFSREDLPSNDAGIDFSTFVNLDEPLSTSLERWLAARGARNQDDPRAGRMNLPATDPNAAPGNSSFSGGGSNTPNSNSTSSPSPHTPRPIREVIDDRNNMIDRILNGR